MESIGNNYNSSSIMREKILTRNEYDFVTNALKENIRVGNRDCFETRELTIKNNQYNDSCIVSLGQTRIISQVSGEIVRPKDSRPNEGILKINLEMSSTLTAYTDTTKQNEYMIEVNRLLERNIIHSRVLDLESLCLRAGEKVWSLKVNLNALNSDGNILDCANIAILCALRKYRLPETSVIDEQITILSEKERMPSQLSVIHMPIIFTFAFFNGGKHVIIDPDELEEGCMDGKLVIGLNKHLEISVMQLSGSVSILREEVIRCVKIATTKVKNVSDCIEEKIS